MNHASVLKWGVKSAAGLALNLLLLTVWVDHVGLSAELAIIPNFVLISICGYVVTNHWIWPDGVSPTTLRGHGKQWAGMQTANFAGKATNYLLYVFFLPLMPYQLAWFLGAVCTFTVTYVANQHWWTRNKKQSAG